MKIDMSLINLKCSECNLILKSVSCWKKSEIEHLKCETTLHNISNIMCILYTYNRGSFPSFGALNSPESWMCRLFVTYATYIILIRILDEDEQVCSPSLVKNSFCETPVFFALKYPR